MRFVKLLVIPFFLSPLMQAQQAPATMVIAPKGQVNLSSTNAEGNNAGKLREMPPQGKAELAEPRKKNFVFKPKAKVNFNEIKTDFAPSLLIKEMPRQSAKKIEYYNYPQTQAQQKTSRSANSLPVPIKGQSFSANPFSIATPSDNDIAISDSGMVVSVMNTNIYIRNTKTNVTTPLKSLFAFTQPINNLQMEFDPKVLYDPSSDKFILACMVGFDDSTSKIIVGFSETNDPTGNWNLYELPGDALENGLWSDYPMIAVSEKEFFLSVNLLYNDSSWQTGFVETIVWQMRKDSGYSGKPMVSQLHSNIKHNGKAIRNLCPVKGGSKVYGPNMYFISNRNLANQNDTVFLVNITDTIGAAGQAVTVKVLKTNQPYYFPPDGRQTVGTQSLATNDCRNLGAFLENDVIQYVHNTRLPANNRVSIYYGIIFGVNTPGPSVTGFIINNDSMDYAYPNISYAGLDSDDHTSIVTFDHSSDKVFAGCSAFQADGQGNFSPVMRIQSGQTYVNVLQGNLERWGDYSGSQRRYNKPGEVWMSGYYAYNHSTSFPRAHGAWVAQLTTDKAFYLGLNKRPEQDITSVNVFPNPVKDKVSVDIDLKEPEYLSFELLDAQGKLITVLLRDLVKVKTNVFSFSTQHLSPGIYFLRIEGNKQTHTTKKIVVN